MTAVVRVLGPLTWLLPGAALALTMTLQGQERGVVSAALAAEASGFEERYDPAESSDFFDFDVPVTSSATTTSASATAFSSLDSSLGALVVSADGQVSATAATTALDARGRAPADSFFEVLFQVDVSGDVLFAGNVQAAFDGADGDAWASVELVDVDGASTLVSYEAAPGEDIAFDQTVSLAANTTYRLTAQSLAYAQASEIIESSAGSASYMIAVPEPSMPLQFVVSWAVLFGLQRWRRSRSRSFSPATARRTRC